ncbi:MAG: NAD(P)H-dependent oxidoreductase subunit E [Proteobacteria bacterium]|jgi:NADH:ubiquinone oxidoreductase subunit E|nr:NAD(P)H-dependent oxidoreductase subunit E [Pseudomonadota bacterium]
MSVFGDGLKAEIEGFLKRYETRRSAILPVLHAIQDVHGWIKPEHIEELHTVYGLDRVHVKEVITFYDIYKDKPVRKFQIRYCKNITCHMLGARPAIARIREHIAALDAAHGEDGAFSLEEFPCLGKCDGAPVMLVNKERVEHATVDKIDQLLTKYAPTVLR